MSSCCCWSAGGSWCRGAWPKERPGRSCAPTDGPYVARPLQFRQLSHLEIFGLTQDFRDSRLESCHVLCSEGLQVSLIDLVPFRIEEHVMPSDLVDLLARPAEKVEVHLGSPRIINAPVAEVFVVHPFDAQHVVHGPADGHR